MRYIRIRENLNNVVSGKDVADEVIMLGSDQGGISDYTYDKIKAENYIIKTLAIKQILLDDTDLDDYIQNADDIREYDGEPFGMLPIISSNGEVIDGYNRIHQYIVNGDDDIEVYYGIKK